MVGRAISGFAQLRCGVMGRTKAIVVRAGTLSVRNAHAHAESSLMGGRHARLREQLVDIGYHDMNSCV